MFKISVNKTKWTSVQARTCAFILRFLIETLILGPKGYGDFRETGPTGYLACSRLRESRSVKRKCKRAEAGERQGGTAPFPKSRASYFRFALF